VLAPVLLHDKLLGARNEPRNTQQDVMLLASDDSCRDQKVLSTPTLRSHRRSNLSRKLQYQYTRIQSLQTNSEQQELDRVTASQRLLSLPN
jgi:hypothetical protein